MSVFTLVTLFCSCDLDVNLMTFTYGLNLDILKMRGYSKMKFLGQGFQKLEHEQEN